MSEQLQHRGASTFSARACLFRCACPTRLVQYGTRHGAMLLGTSWREFTYNPARDTFCFFSRSDTAPVMLSRRAQRLVFLHATRTAGM